MKWFIGGVFELVGILVSLVLVWPLLAYAATGDELSPAGKIGAIAVNVVWLAWLGWNVFLFIVGQ
jgi:hypothetical protein